MIFTSRRLMNVRPGNKQSRPRIPRSARDFPGARGAEASLNEHRIMKPNTNNTPTRGNLATRREFLKTTSGAAANALSTKSPVKLWAMADVFDHRLEGSFKSLSAKHASRMFVP